MYQNWDTKDRSHVLVEAELALSQGLEETKEWTQLLDGLHDDLFSASVSLAKTLHAP
jgi:hypothetical protein